MVMLTLFSKLRQNKNNITNQKAASWMLAAPLSFSLFFFYFSLFSLKRQRNVQATELEIPQNHFNICFSPERFAYKSYNMAQIQIVKLQNLQKKYNCIFFFFLKKKKIVASVRFMLQEMYGFIITAPIASLCVSQIFSQYFVIPVFVL